MYFNDRIAAALGEVGATVVCTGRSSVTGRGGSDDDRPEIIEETAELVTQLGGIGIAIQVDHLDAEQVRALAERVRNDLGHIEVLVNDIWGAEHLKGGPADWNTPIWEHDLDKGLRILCLAIETHLITFHHLLPLINDEPDVSSSRSPTERLTTTLRTIGSRCSTTSPRWR